MTNVMIFGLPASGKGTQAEYLQEKYGIVQISAGELLREAAESDTPIGDEIKKYMNDGILVPNHITVSLIEKKIADLDSFTLDGFPRSRAQAELLDEMLTKTGKKIDHIILLDVDEKALVERVTGRFSCADKKCKTGYNDKTKPTKIEGVCDKCGSTEFTRREDDTEKKLVKRIATYHSETKPVIKYYAEQGRLEIVDGNRDMAEVSKSISKLIEKKGVSKVLRPGTPKKTSGNVQQYG